MASLNKVFLIGNLTRAPELRYTPSGTAVSDLRLAVNRSYTTQGGEKREETCFLTVVVWGKQAESAAQYLDKGSPVLVEGRLQTRDWETKDGQKRNVVEVVAERLQFLGRGRPRRAAAGSDGSRGGRGGGGAPTTCPSEVSRGLALRIAGGEANSEEANRWSSP